VAKISLDEDVHKKCWTLSIAGFVTHSLLPDGGVNSSAMRISARNFLSVNETKPNIRNKTPA
jgi:hypothetical protein